MITKYYVGMRDQLKDVENKIGAELKKLQLEAGFSSYEIFKCQGEMILNKFE